MLIILTFKCLNLPLANVAVVVESLLGQLQGLISVGVQICYALNSVRASVQRWQTPVCDRSEFQHIVSESAPGPLRLHHAVERPPQPRSHLCLVQCRLLCTVRHQPYRTPEKRTEYVDSIHN